MLKILLLSDHLSVHTIKWARSLAGEGLKVSVFSLSAGGTDDYDDLPEIEITGIGIRRESFRSSASLVKLRYLMALGALKRVLKEFRPDIVHAHYATSYGLLGALSGFRPFIISVWGSDVYDFPSNFIKRGLLRFNLSRAVRILSTSEVMAEETLKYTEKKITVTPFGIDVDRFAPQTVRSLFSREDLVIGTIKSLEKKYGIEYLIRAFYLVKKRFPGKALKLLIVGKGTLEGPLKELCRSLDLQADVVFSGWISHEEVPVYLNMLDIYVALSVLDSESFGVAILEASSSGKPVVVSNVGGLPEVVENGRTGLVVPKCDEQAAAEALATLIGNAGLRRSIGEAGRNRVIRKYEWKSCVDQMKAIYSSVVQAG